MNFLIKHQHSINVYAKACPMSAIIFFLCAIITDENPAWLVAYSLLFATFITSILAQLAQVCKEYKEYKKSEAETEN